MVIRRSVLKLSRNRKFFSGAIPAVRIVRSFSGSQAGSLHGECGPPERRVRPRVYQNHRPLRTMWRCRFQGKGRSNGSNTREVNADSV